MLRTDVNTLYAALSRGLPLIQQRSTIPILSTMLLRTEAGVLTVSATDLDMQVDVEALVEAKGDAEAAIMPRQAVNVLRLLPKRDSIELVLDGGGAFLIWNGGKVRLPTLPACDWPQLNVTGDRIEADFTEADFKALAAVMPFISSEETRYYLNGVCLDRWKDTALAVATDGSKLCSQLLQPGMLAIADAARKMIVPRETVRRMLAIRPEEAKVAIYARNQGPAFFEAAGQGVRLRSKTIDGDCPDWSRVVAIDAGVRLEVDRPRLLRAAAMVDALIPQRDNGHAVIVAEVGRLQLQSTRYESSVAIDLGEAEPDLKLELPVNARFLLQALNVIRGPVAVFTCADPASPLRLSGQDERDGENVIVMPLRSASRPSFSAPIREAA